VRREDPDRLLRDIGLRLVELRERRGLSRETWAEQLGVSVRYLGRLERGRQNLTVERLAWLASHLGVRVVDLFAAPGIDAIRVGRPPQVRPPQSKRRGS
jgi:transcriptional regulator with XRE-family HTH domain